jgi:DNA helicase-2/ATP-dependent DNA helicase PcrA
LFYVAITRAKSRLWLTYANSRYRFGSLVQNEPSRFLEEMPEQFIDRSYAGGNAMRNTFGGGGGGLWNNGGNSMFDRKKPQGPATSSTPGPARTAPKPATAPAGTHVPSPGVTPDDPALMEAGMEVEHQKFGFGTILSMEGAPNNRIATVVFPKGGGEKKIMLNYARLMIVKK